MSDHSRARTRTFGTPSAVRRTRSTRPRSDATSPSARSDAPLRPDAAPAADDTCYILYTSGTTGRPKGVAIRHQSFVNFIRVAAASYGYRPGLDFVMSAVATFTLFEGETSNLYTISLDPASLLNGNGNFLTDTGKGLGHLIISCKHLVFALFKYATHKNLNSKW